MHQRHLGQHNVSAIGFGAMNLSTSRQRPSEQEAIRVIHSAVDAGMTLIDTAESYCIDSTEAGHNERLIGKALSQLPSGRRDRVRVATKFGSTRPGGAWVQDGTAPHTREATEQSLRNLRVETLFLQQYHRRDPGVPIAETWGELLKLQQEGKILMLGVSNHTVQEMKDVLALGAQIVSLQNRYGRDCRDPEFDGTLEFARTQGMAFIPYCPLGGTHGQALTNHPGIAVIARQRGVSPQQVALAWLLAAGPHIIPIPGSTNVEHVRDCAAADLKLTAEELAMLAAERPACKVTPPPSAPGPGRP